MTVADIEYAGAKPVFVDIDPELCTMGPRGLELAITPRTKAVVHARGAGAQCNACRGQLNTSASRRASITRFRSLQPAYRDLGYAAGDFPVAEAVAAEVLSLPMFPELTDAQMRRVAGALDAASAARAGAGSAEL